MERRSKPLSSSNTSSQPRKFRNPSPLPNDGLRVKPDHSDAEVLVDTRPFYAKKRFWFNLLLFAFLFYTYLGQWLIGTYYYQAHYIGAALGDAALETACAGVKKVKNPWRNLSRRDWYRLQSCLGNEDGWERQGDLMGLVKKGFRWVWWAVNPLGPVPTFLGAGFGLYWVISGGYDKMIAKLHQLPGRTLAQVTPSSMPIFAGLMLLFIPLRIIAILLVLGCIFGPGLYSWNRARGRQATVDGEIAAAIQPSLHKTRIAVSYLPRLKIILTYAGDMISSIFFHNKCHHIQNCSCDRTDIKDLESELEGRKAKVQILEGRLRQIQEQNNKLQETVASSNFRRPSRVSENGGPAIWWNREDKRPVAQSSGLPQSPASTAFGQDRSLVEALRKALTESDIEKRAQETRYEARVRNLKAQLEYATGEGNVALFKDEVDSLKSQLRLKQKDLNLAQRNAAQALQQLEFEREGTSLSCRNEARCQLLIQKLEGERQLLFEQHAANDIMVQQAALEFGKSEAEAKRYTLRTYLQEITQAMVQQIAAGGLGKVKNQPAFKGILNNMDKTRIRELEAYKNRLEDEVHRLGGNVQIMRLGLDPKRPKPFHDLTYDAFSSGAFKVYSDLCVGAKTLTDIFISSGTPLIEWNHDPPRTDASNRRFIECIDLLDHRPILALNPKFDQYEILVQSLVRAEISRLFNRVIDLKRVITRYPAENTALYRDRVLNPLAVVGSLSRTAVLYLDDIRVLEKRYTNIEDSMLAARAARRYKIWRAMQEAIECLIKAIESFNAFPPAWREERDRPPPSFDPTKTFEDLVARLVKFEINSLEDRMLQLVTFMESERLPGTTNGQPRLAGSPSYQANWDALYTAKLYALLCRDHWYTECYPSAPSKIKLPLDHPPLLHALRREKGDVLVTVPNPFPWKLSGGALRPVTVVDAGAEGLHKTAILEDNVPSVKWSLPSPTDDEAPSSVMADYATERRYYDKHYACVAQLRTFIDASEVRRDHGPPLWRTNDVSMGLMQAKKGWLWRECVDLEVFMHANGLVVPGWPHEGGGMVPGKGFGGEGGWTGGKVVGSWEGEGDEEMV
ncbi:hypothetical protein GLAREA_01245 [Glarea lozoyensis ATCC 20868]|uniref:Uncharacterized protein n=1 Tax=Glarea lozoyensis (strain ATCC 20868 / MF5171) TaxID=1116229 RepID=S3DFC0_GLAL2|nr:uncharacterized protein GLAREA_01245 [Glarea lozoyensis ATCC 20868]EPE25333.1 hypothetical protein GLAREA_01245 [Glarea lozoyensis ATCC 20868]